MRRLRGEQDREVGRQRLEPAHLYELDPGVGRPGVEVVDDPANERDLPRQVGVVRCTGHASFDHGPAVRRVRPDEVENDAGAGGHGCQGIRVVDVGHDGLGRTRARLAEHPLELHGIARRCRPARSGLGSPLGQVRRDAAAGHPRRPEDDYVKVSLAHDRRRYRPGRRLRGRPPCETLLP